MKRYVGAVIFVVGSICVTACDSAADNKADAGPTDPTVDGSSTSPDAEPSAVDASLVDGAGGTNEQFSFFRTSFAALTTICASELGCGGDLGGLAGADSICKQTAAMVGAGDRNWKAFLSATNNGTPIHAIDRIGTGPWYDANGNLVANAVAGLIAGMRPEGDSAGNLADEYGTLQPEDNEPGHDVLTGSNDEGRLRNSNPASTCNDWTSSSADIGGDLVGVGHGAIAGSQNPGWIRAHTVGGCAAGYDFEGRRGGPVEMSVGSGNGYGAIYCFVSNQ